MSRSISPLLLRGCHCLRQLHADDGALTPSLDATARGAFRPSPVPSKTPNKAHPQYMISGAHPAHTHICLHGMKMCVLRPSVHTQHSVSSPDAGSSPLEAATADRRAAGGDA